MLVTEVVVVETSTCAVAVVETPIAGGASVAPCAAVATVVVAGAWPDF